VLIRCKFCGKKVFQQIQDGGLNGFFHLSRQLEFFEKICVFPTPNECKKKIEKILDPLRVISKTQYFQNSLKI
jgi:hypothetical protein